MRAICSTVSAASNWKAWKLWTPEQSRSAMLSNWDCGRSPQRQPMVLHRSKFHSHPTSTRSRI